MEDDQVSPIEFARRIGKSKEWVYKQIRAGVLTVDRKDKKLPFKKSVADYEKHFKCKLNVNSPTDAEQNVSAAMGKAKLAKETFQAKLKELEYKFRTGELLEKKDVEADAAALASEIKNQLLAVPPRISSMCEGRVAREIEEIMLDGINDALKKLQKFNGA